MNKNLCLGLMLAFGAVSCGNNKDRNIVQEEIVDAEDHLTVDSIKVAQHADTANVEIEVSSPPPKYGDTVDLGTFVAGEEWHAGCLVWNKSDSYLIFEKTVTSDPLFKCDVRLHEVRPEMGVSVIGSVKFDKPVGNFKIKAEIYWKNIKNPTVVYFKGNCVKNTN